ncbi:alpha/beta fold hydrolase [Nocardia sp. XZ_19_385]|uniref:alpha/beta fold hydrolase n=1 Tax=Nocardia sp. XZ_19_385 TaxID=2769488 RepID=UPI0018906F6B|nr:alpha/beta hydrolase [Nocardia sp. XZ_19_385]
MTVDRRRKRKQRTIAVLAAVTGVLAGAGTAVAAPADPLARFSQQELQWKSCDDPGLDPAGAQCADVTVPLNYAEPQGRTITMAISRIPATDPAQRRGIMMSNSGGPGGPGLDFMVEVGSGLTPQGRAAYDLIGMDPRGVGRSTPINCGWPRGFGLHSAGVDAGSFAESVAMQSELAARCATAYGDALQHYNTRNTARDMDVIRGLLGADRISYYGTSYGTYLGAVFMQMFPERSDRFVLDSSVDPHRYGAGMLRDMGPANEAALDLWADWAAGHDGEFRLGATRDQVRATLVKLIERAGRDPIKVGEYLLDDHWLPMVPYVGLDDPRKYELIATQIRQIADAAEGKTVQPGPELTTILALVTEALPRDSSAQMAIMCGDVGVPRDPSWYWGNIEAARASQPVFGAFSNNITPCAFWAPPAEAPTAVGNSSPALIVQSTGDTRTTYGAAQAMRQALSGSRMVTLQDVPIHAIFGRYPNTCVYGAINSYFDTGVLPEADYSCRVD